ncbi:MAG: hypothetical protein A2X18_09710 [Bacteroidetes bacterium GWF2_40_14]|nr:MAG: hypothetical protein A2X18_09710 [Bacteroidetes bacterium GWF2_40_14]
MCRSAILKECAKPLVHIRQQLNSGRFGLVIGSGISKPFLLPNWAELIENISKNPEINGEDILNYKKNESPQASVTQMLYEHFKAKEKEKEGDSINSKEFEKLIYHRWKDIIHQELWKNFKPEYLKKGVHPYLDAYIDIIKRSSLTINYNFDNTLQLIISDRRSDDEKRIGIKGYETVWDARLQFQSNNGVIYHPNGFLPKELIDGPSETIVFSEDSFADQLIATMSGHYSTLLHHLSKNTCLFLGLSLEDSTLKHLLRQNSQISPGHFHYYIAYTKDSESISDEQKRAIIESNFELYNLITLFFNDKEIKEFGELLQMGDSDFEEEAILNKIDTKYIYYITGPVGSGKTTTLSYFRNMSTFSEWPDPKHPLLAVPEHNLLPEETKFIDKWIGSQFYKKNKNIRNSRYGFNVIDRTPLDPFTFKDESEWGEKAEDLNNQITRGASQFRIEKGCIILLHGDNEVIARRVRMRQKTEDQYTSTDIEKMYKKFIKIFDSLEHLKIIDTSDLSVFEVVRRVARIIHLEKYYADDLHSVIDKYLKC